MRRNPKIQRWRKTIFANNSYSILQILTMVKVLVFQFLFCWFDFHLVETWFLCFSGNESDVEDELILPSKSKKGGKSHTKELHKEKIHVLSSSNAESSSDNDVSFFRHLGQRQCLSEAQFWQTFSFRSKWSYNCYLNLIFFLKNYWRLS